LVSSISMAVREEGFWGIGLTSSVTKRGRVANMARIRGEKRPDRPLFDQTKGNWKLKPGTIFPRILASSMSAGVISGFCMTLTYLAAPRSDFSLGLVGSFRMRRSPRYRTQSRSANIIEAEAAKRGLNNLRVITAT
jgi:hypothetical protein